MDKRGPGPANRAYQPGIWLAVLIGLLSVGIKQVMESPLADPLLISLFIGIMVRSAMWEYKKSIPGLASVPRLFIPVGIIFYGANNLNFIKLREVDGSILILLGVVMIVYFSVILLLGRLLGQRKQVTYLTATGSAICGASAIAVTSPAVEAEPDDISVSLLSVALAGFVGFAIIIPFIAALLDMSCKTHCVLSGSVLQFTGMVKVSNMFTPYMNNNVHPHDTVPLALSVKAVRYLGLLFAIPFFASLTKKKFYIPWFLWAFLAAGLCGTWLYASGRTFFDTSFVPYIKPVHQISWSIAMAAIGLNANIRELLSNSGAKAIIMAFGGFLSAVAIFLIGLYIV